MQLLQPELQSSRAPGHAILARQAPFLRSQIVKRKQRSVCNSVVIKDAATAASVTTMGAQELQGRVDAFLAGYRHSQHMEHAYWVDESMVRTGEMHLMQRAQSRCTNLR
jgi:hypothetical protein